MIIGIKESESMKKLSLVLGMICLSVFPALSIEASENTVDIQGEYVSFHDLVSALGGSVEVDAEDDTAYHFKAQDKDVYIRQAWGYSTVNEHIEPLFLETAKSDESVTVVLYKTPILFEDEVFVPIEYTERLFDLTFKDGSFEQDGTLVGKGEDLVPLPPVVETPPTNNDSTDNTEETPIEKENVVQGVLLNKTSVKISVGQSEKVNAAVNPFDVSDTSLTWSSDNEAVATVDHRGNISGVGVGEATVTVQSNLTPSVTTTIKVIVSEVGVESIHVDKTSIDLTVGGSAKVSSWVKPDHATNKSVSWTSENKGVATVDGSGNVKAVAAGETRIVVTSDSNNELKAYVTVKVKEPVVEKPVTPPTDSGSGNGGSSNSGNGDGGSSNSGGTTVSNINVQSIIDKAGNILGCTDGYYSWSNWMGCDGAAESNSVSINKGSGSVALSLNIFEFDEQHVNNFYSIIRLIFPSEGQALVNKLNDPNYWGGTEIVEGHKVVLTPESYWVSVIIYN